MSMGAPSRCAENVDSLTRRIEGVVDEENVAECLAEKARAVRHNGNVATNECGALWNCIAPLSTCGVATR